MYTTWYVGTGTFRTKYTYMDTINSRVQSTEYRVDSMYDTKNNSTRYCTSTEYRTQRPTLTRRKREGQTKTQVFFEKIVFCVKTKKVLKVVHRVGGHPVESIGKRIFHIGILFRNHHTKEE